MDVDRFKRPPIGSLLPVKVWDRSGNVFEHFAFAPAPLPQSLDLKAATVKTIAEAERALGRLDGAVRRLPNPHLIARPALREEAISTSALEGTYTTIDSLMKSELLEEPESATGVVTEVRNYVMAAELGLRMIETLPISLRVVLETHGLLMHGARGNHARAGHFRESQNWIGPAECTIAESDFVPPPPGDVLMEGLSDWEKWVNRVDDLPLLAKIAVAHYQFETLHPFVDGNGRIGRLLVILTLIASEVLSLPLVNISPYLEKRRPQYQAGLREVSMTGDLDAWVSFFVEGLRLQAERALTQAEKLLDFRERTVGELRKAGLKGNAIAVAELLIGYPFISTAEAARLLDVSYQAASYAINRLVDAGVLEQLPGGRKVFEAPGLLRILS